MHRGTTYADTAHPVTGNEIYLQQTNRSVEMINGDFLIIDEPRLSKSRSYFCSVAQIEESPLYVRNPDSIVFLTRRLEAENRDLTDIADLPEARKETKIVIRARIHKTRSEDGITGPGYRPSSVAIFREPFASEIEEFLNVPTEGFPLFLVRSNGELYRDVSRRHTIVRMDTKAPLTGMLAIGSPGSGKTMFNGALAWWYSTQNWACILINNKADDLLYLDQKADYEDPKWGALGWRAEGVRDFQVIYPKLNGCSRTSGNLVPFSFDAEALQPEALTALIEFSERGVMHLPHLFRHWKENSGGTIESFIDYLESGHRQGMYVSYTMRVKGRLITRRIHSSTIDSAVSILQSYADYFGEKGDMPSADEIVKPGKVTVFDLSRADTTVSRLMIQHYLHEIRSLQRARITGEGTDLVPALFEVDEAHQYFKRYSNDEMSREIERELETHVKLSRSLKVATLLASQLGSELHPAANRLATVKMILRSDRTEVKALGIPLGESELAAVEAFSPGMAQLRDGYRIKVPVYVRIPMSPAQVRGQT
jgi:DNA helicase HerA-like ATPase